MGFDSKKPQRKKRTLFEAILLEFKNCVRLNRYVVTTHAEEEMDEDRFSIFDIESAILNGEVVERQKENETSECKYLIRGDSLDGRKLIVVTKMSPSRKMVIITVFEDDS